MVRKKKKFYTEEIKRQAVQDYVSGKKSAEEVARELETSAGLIYKWRVAFDEAAKGQRVAELEERGFSAEVARLLQQKDEEIALYQKKLAQQVLINDLLKKLQPGASLQPESELSGLIATGKKLDQKKKLAKQWG